MARITFNTMYDTTMRYLQKNAGELNKMYEQIASEQMINRPSDNPVGFTNAMNYRNILNSLGQKQINMDDGEAYMTVLETVHQKMNNLFGRSRDLAVQAANDTMNHQQRLFINVEMRENLEQLVAMSQTKHKDAYIFSGKWTNQPPYEIKNATADYRMMPDDISYQVDPLAISSPYFDREQPITFQLYDSAYIDPNIVPHPDNPMTQCIIPGSVEGLIGLKERTYPDELNPDYEIDYVNGTITLFSEDAKLAFYNQDGTAKPAGDLPNMKFDYIYRNSIDMSGEIYREVETGITVKINTNPDDLFGRRNPPAMDAFQEMITFMQGLWYDDQPQINKGIEALDVASKRNLEQQAVEGARLNRFALTKDRNEELTTANTEADSKIEGVDLAEALTQFSLSQAVYNASLQAAANLMQRSLIDYLR